MINHFSEGANGGVLACDVGGLAPVFADCLRTKRYRLVSAEIYDEPPAGLPRDPQTGAPPTGKMLRRVAFLGGDVPEVKGLGSVPLPEGDGESITGVNLFAAGDYRGKDYSEADLADIERNFALYSTGDDPAFPVPAVVGHSEDQSWLADTGLPAAGWVTACSAGGTGRPMRYSEGASSFDPAAPGVMGSGACAAAWSVPTLYGTWAVFSERVDDDSYLSDVVAEAIREALDDLATGADVPGGAMGVGSGPQPSATGDGSAAPGTSALEGLEVFAEPSPEERELARHYRGTAGQHHGMGKSRLDARNAGRQRQPGEYATAEEMLADAAGRHRRAEQLDPTPPDQRLAEDGTDPGQQQQSDEGPEGDQKRQELLDRLSRAGVDVTSLQGLDLEGLMEMVRVADAKAGVPGGSLGEGGFDEPADAREAREHYGHAMAYYEHASHHARRFGVAGAGGPGEMAEPGMSPDGQKRSDDFERAQQMEGQARVAARGGDQQQAGELFDRAGNLERTRRIGATPMPGSMDEPAQDQQQEAPPSIDEALEGIVAELQEMIDSGEISVPEAEAALERAADELCDDGGPPQGEMAEPDRHPNTHDREADDTPMSSLPHAKHMIDENNNYNGTSSNDGHGQRHYGDAQYRADLYLTPQERRRLHLGRQGDMAEMTPQQRLANLHATGEVGTSATQGHGHPEGLDPEGLADAGGDRDEAQPAGWAHGRDRPFGKELADAMNSGTGGAREQSRQWGLPTDRPYFDSGGHSVARQQQDYTDAQARDAGLMGEDAPPEGDAPQNDAPPDPAALDALQDGLEQAVASGVISAEVAQAVLDAACEGCPDDDPSAPDYDSVETAPGEMAEGHPHGIKDLYDAADAAADRGDEDGYRRARAQASRLAISGIDQDAQKATKGTPMERTFDDLRARGNYAEGGRARDAGLGGAHAVRFPFRDPYGRRLGGIDARGLRGRERHGASDEELRRMMNSQGTRTPEREDYDEDDDEQPETRDQREEREYQRWKDYWDERDDRTGYREQNKHNVEPAGQVPRDDQGHPTRDRHGEPRRLQKMKIRRPPDDFDEQDTYAAVMERRRRERASADAAPANAPDYVTLSRLARQRGRHADAEMLENEARRHGQRFDEEHGDEDGPETEAQRVARAHQRFDGYWQEVSANGGGRERDKHNIEPAGQVPTDARGRMVRDQHGPVDRHDAMDEPQPQYEYVPDHRDDRDAGLHATDEMVANGHKWRQGSAYQRLRGQGLSHEEALRQARPNRMSEPPAALLAEPRRAELRGGGGGGRGGLPPRNTPRMSNEDLRVIRDYEAMLRRQQAEPMAEEDLDVHGRPITGSTPPPDSVRQADERLDAAYRRWRKQGHHTQEIADRVDRTQRAGYGRFRGQTPADDVPMAEGDRTRREEPTTGPPAPGATGPGPVEQAGPTRIDPAARAEELATYGRSWLAATRADVRQARGRELRHEVAGARRVAAANPAPGQPDAPGIAARLQRLRARTADNPAPPQEYGEDDFDERRYRMLMAKATGRMAEGDETAWQVQQRNPKAARARRDAASHYHANSNGDPFSVPDEAELEAAARQDQLDSDIVAGATRERRHGHPALRRNTEDAVSIFTQPPRRRFAERFTENPNHQAHGGDMNQQDVQTIDRAIAQGIARAVPGILKQLTAGTAASSKEAVQKAAEAQASLQKFAEEQQAAQKKLAVDAVLERLGVEGKVPPVNRDRVRSRLMRADARAVVEKFTEGGVEKSLTEYDLAVAEYDALPSFFTERLAAGTAGTAGGEAPDAEVAKVEAHYESFAEDGAWGKGLRSHTPKDEFVGAFKARRKREPATTAESFLNPRGK